MTTHPLSDPSAPPVYIHGLEGSPMGTKGRFIEQTFGRSGPEMPASRDAQGGRPSCFEACYERVVTYLHQHPASVIIGSSFGGAITMALLQRGVWRGPIVLLAPAIQYYGLALTLPAGVHAVIIHDPSDDIIPFAGSQALQHANPLMTELRESDGGHRLHTITSNGMLERAVREQLARAAKHKP